jgi:acyl carrier protein
MDEKLTEIMCGVLEIDRVSETDSTQTIATWDSLHHLQLMTAIEEAYGIMLDPEEMMQLSSVASIQAALARHGQA